MENRLNPRLSVSDFLASVNQTFEYAYPLVEIEGEVASFKVNQGKFVFFDLKDEESSVPCFMMLFSLRIAIEDGMKVRIVARPKMTKWGKFSLTVDHVLPIGEGALKKSFELLKAKLEKEGIFENARKRPLPEHIMRVGVISSIQAAGYGDFIKIINERWGGMNIDVAHVQVQGVGAADQIVRALQYFNECADTPDVIVIIRGGGSADDLAVFNDEVLVRAIASSRVVTVVGIGHEQDIVLAELAADVRGSTPTNVAQIITPDKSTLLLALRHQQSSMLERIIGACRDTRLELSSAQEMMIAAYARATEYARNYAVHAAQLLRARSPQQVLERGYAIIRGTAQIGETVIAETAKEIITMEVRDVKAK